MSALLPSDSALGGSPTETPMTDRLPIGREVDALVAEQVMGWTRSVVSPHPTDNRAIGGVMYCLPGCGGDEWAVRDVPRFSKYIADAWEIIGTLHGNTEKWYRFHKALTLNVLPSFGATGLHELESSLAAWAICLAAVASSSQETPNG